MQSCPDERSEDGSPGQVAVTGWATSRHPASYFPPASYQLIAFQAVILRIICGLPLCHKPIHRSSIAINQALLLTWTKPPLRSFPA